MSRRDFVEALREAERARESASLSPFAERRILRALSGEAPKHRFYLPLGLGAAAAAAAVALVVWTASPQRAAEPALAFGPDGSVTFERPGTPLRDAQHRVTVRGQTGAKLAQAPAGLRMVQGTASFEVDARAPGEPPFVVFVSHGHIEVLGTRFTVVQRADGGEVRLHEGRIRFTGSDGRAEDLVPGGALSWPLEPLAQAPAPPAPIASPDAPPVPEARTAPGLGAPRPFDVEAFIEGELDVLRRRGAFAEAAARLEAVLRRPLAEDTHERLSYELGTILTRQVGDAGRACKVWKAHRQRHPDGRYAREVAAAEAFLNCP